MPRINASFLKGLTSGVGRGAQGFMSGDAAYQDSFDKQAQLQTRLAQSIAQARNADASARYHDAQTDNEAAKTGALNRRPDLFKEQVAAASGTDIPMVERIRRAIAGNPDRYDMGPTTEDGVTAAVPINPDTYSGVARSIQQFFPLLANAGDINPEQMAKAADLYRDFGREDQMMAGKLDPTSVARAKYAIKGSAPYHFDASGLVGNNLTGGVDLSNPRASAYTGEIQAKTRQADASAGASNAQAAKITQETAQGQKGRYDPASGMIIDERAGTARPVVGPDGKPLTMPDKGMTDSQAKANLFGSRMAEADRIIRELEGKYSPLGVKAKVAAGDLPIVGGAAGATGNWLLSESGQRAEQAQRDFINAVLRRESGAVISSGEFANANLQYFPQPNDKPETLKQKARNRRMAIDGMLAEVPASKRGALPGLASPGGERNIQVDY